jgi:hypothetical protein
MSFLFKTCLSHVEGWKNALRPGATSKWERRGGSARSACGETTKCRARRHGRSYAYRCCQLPGAKVAARARAVANRRILVLPPAAAKRRANRGPLSLLHFREDTLPNAKLERCIRETAACTRGALLVRVRWWEASGNCKNCLLPSFLMSML